MQSYVAKWDGFAKNSNFKYIADSTLDSFECGKGYHLILSI